MGRQRRQILSAVLLVALAGLVLRLAAVVLLHAWQNPNAIEHRALALNLLNGEGFTFGDFGYYGPSSVQSPPYPLLLAGLFALFGADAPAAYLAAMVLNAVAGALCVALVYLLVRQLGGGVAAGLVAAVLCALWPSQIYAVTHAQAITLITTGVVAIILLFYRSVSGDGVACGGPSRHAGALCATGSATACCLSARADARAHDSVRTGRTGLGSWIAFSLVGTLAALTEPVLLPMMAFTGILILLWRGLPPLVRLRNAGLLLASAVVVIGPWTIRNRLVHGQWVPIKSTFWVNVWKGNNNHATGTDRLAMDEQQAQALDARQSPLDDAMARDPQFDKARQYDRLSPQDRQRLWGQPEAQRELVFKGLATSWIKAHPQRYLELCLARLGKTLWVDNDNPKSRKLVYEASRWLLAGLSVLGLAAAWRQGWRLLYPLLLAGSCLVTYTLTVTAARFSLPLEPLQLCLAAQFIVTALRWDRGGSPNRLSADQMGCQLPVAIKQSAVGSRQSAVPNPQALNPEPRPLNPMTDPGSARAGGPR